MEEDKNEDKVVERDQSASTLKIKTTRKWVEDTKDIIESYIARTRHGRVMMREYYLLYHLRDPG